MTFARVGGTPIGQALINVFAHDSPAVTIYGPTQLNQNQAGTFTATASSGAPPTSINGGKRRMESQAPGRHHRRFHPTGHQLITGI